MALTRTKCIVNWRRCNNCKIILTHQDVEAHISSDCPPINGNHNWSYGYISEKKLYSFLKIFEPQEKNEMFFNDVIQLSLTVAQLCEFPIGDPVMITAKNFQHIVKLLWPIEDNLLSSVFLTQQSLEELDCYEGPVEIKKIEHSVPLAKSVLLKLIKPETMSESQITEVMCMLNINLNNSIIVTGQHLVIAFYGLRPKFKIIEVAPYSTVSDSLTNLNDTLANINICENEIKVYKVFSNTKWKIITEIEDVKEKCSDVYCLSKLGGIDNIICDLKDIMYNIVSSDNIKGEKVSCGIIIHGVSGVGKSSLAKAMINATKLPAVYIHSWQVFSKFVGEAETRLKLFFDQAIEKAPSIILIDELETFCPLKFTSDQEKRILSVLLSMLDKLNNFRVVVLGITRKIDMIDPALRRPGRFDYEIEIPIPDPDAKIDILQHLLLSYQHKISKEVIQELCFNASHGFVGSDLSLACRLANTRAFNDTVTKNCENDQNSSDNSNIELPLICQEQLIWAFSQIKPTAMKEILVEIPNIKWGDIGGLDEVKLKLQQVLEWPLKHPDSFKRLGITPQRGVLLFGPPGCSKTMIAKAVATETKLNFISIKGAELFSKWVGESEKAVREVFRRARTVSPSVVFFDEIDALGSHRDTSSSESGSNVQDRVLSQLLTELDGIQPLNNVTVIAATNRPDRIDSALLRPGRFDQKLYIPLPNCDTRRAIFSLQFEKTPVDVDVNITELVNLTEGYSGAEVIAVCHEAAIKALQENIMANTVKKDNFFYALSIIQPRTPKSLLKIYDSFLENK